MISREMFLLSISPVKQILVQGDRDINKANQDFPREMQVHSPRSVEL